MSFSLSKICFSKWRKVYLRLSINDLTFYYCAMDMQAFKLATDLYVSPWISVYEIQNEGALCTSGTHDSFYEDDEWIELLEE